MVGSDKGFSQVGFLEPPRGQGYIGMGRPGGGPYGGTTRADLGSDHCRGRPGGGLREGQAAYVQQPALLASGEWLAVHQFFGQL